VGRPYWDPYGDVFYLGGSLLALSVSPVQEGRTCDAVPPLTPAIEPCHLTCLFLFFVFAYVDFTNGDICLCPQRLLRDRVRSAAPEPSLRAGLRGPRQVRAGPHELSLWMNSEGRRTA
jgi:hypothetical protein